MFEPTSITPTLMPVILPTTPVGATELVDRARAMPLACARAPPRAPHQRRAASAARRSPFLGAARVHVPSAPSSQPRRCPRAACRRRAQLACGRAGPRPARRPRSGGRGCAASGRRCRGRTSTSSPASKTKSAAVLEEAAERSLRTRMFSLIPSHARAERADRARDDLDLRARLRRPRRAPRSSSSSVSALTLIRIARGLAVRGRLRDRADLLDQAGAQVERRDEQLPEPLRPAEAGQVVEEVGDVGRDVLVGREEAEVLVERAVAAW